MDFIFNPAMWAFLIDPINYWAFLFDPAYYVFLSDPKFWGALGSIIMIDLLLGGDNAVVIALACSKLPPESRNKAILYGTAGAVGLRIVLLMFAAWLLKIPGIMLVGSALLIWVAYKLLSDGDDGENHSPADNFWSAIKTIIIADAVMSVDNVIAVAGVSTHGGDHQNLLMVLGVLISIPIIVWASKFIIGAIERFPVIKLIGSLLLVHVGVGLLFKEHWYIVAEQVANMGGAAKYVEWAITGGIAGWFTVVYYRQKTN